MRRFRFSRSKHPSYSRHRVSRQKPPSAEPSNSKLSTTQVITFVTVPAFCSCSRRLSDCWTLTRRSITGKEKRKRTRFSKAAVRWSSALLGFAPVEQDRITYSGEYGTFRIWKIGKRVVTNQVGEGAKKFWQLCQYIGPSEEEALGGVARTIRGSIPKINWARYYV